MSEFTVLSMSKYRNVAVTYCISFINIVISNGLKEKKDKKHIKQLYMVKQNREEWLLGVHIQSFIYLSIVTTQRETIKKRVRPLDEGKDAYAHKNYYRELFIISKIVYKNISLHTNVLEEFMEFL